MNTEMIFEIIKAERFFPKYLPHIKNYKRKISQRNSKGNQTDFTDQEKKEIIKAIGQFHKDAKT